VLDKLNDITNPDYTIENLDYTIELDGVPYNITAADSLNADVARRVVKALHVIQSGYPANPSKNLEDETIGTPEETEYYFDGHYAQKLSVVPSNGGTFTGPIAIPNVTSLNENNHYAINLGSVRGLIKNLAGFPTYIWDGTTLIEITENNKFSLSPFKVILHNINNAQQVAQDPDPLSDICFKNEKTERINCWFLAINAYTGWTSLGRCFADGSKTQYYQLRVQKVDYAKTISKYNEDDVPDPNYTNITNEDKTNKNYKNRPFNHARLLELEDNLYESDTEGTIIYEINNSITENTTKIENLTTQVVDNRLELEKHINDRAMHRLIAHGTSDVVNDSNFKTDYNNELIKNIKVDAVNIPSKDSDGHLSVDENGQPITTSVKLNGTIPSKLGDDDKVPIGSIYIKLES
jgi:hypothetical protein